MGRCRSVHAFAVRRLRAVARGYISPSKFCDPSAQCDAHTCNKIAAAPCGAFVDTLAESCVAHQECLGVPRVESPEKDFKNLCARILHLEEHKVEKVVQHECLAVSRVECLEKEVRNLLARISHLEDSRAECPEKDFKRLCARISYLEDSRACEFEWLEKDFRNLRSRFSDLEGLCARVSYLEDSRACEVEWLEKDFRNLCSRISYLEDSRADTRAECLEKDFKRMCSRISLLEDGCAESEVARQKAADLDEFSGDSPYVYGDGKTAEKCIEISDSSYAGPGNSDKKVADLDEFCGDSPYVYGDGKTAKKCVKISDSSYVGPEKSGKKVGDVDGFSGGSPYVYGDEKAAKKCVEISDSSYVGPDISGRKVGDLPEVGGERKDPASLPDFLCGAVAHVRLHGLRNVAFNGRIGVVTSRDALGGRVAILLHGEKDAKSFKVENLMKYVPHKADKCNICKERVMLTAFPPCACDHKE